MSIFLGGSGSVGSTLLASILNRHPDVFCGPELSLFNKQEAFETWQAAKSKILYKPDRFVTWGWGPYSGTSLLDQEFGWTSDELQSLLKKSSDIHEFAEAFFARPLSLYSKAIWAEKTPSNSFCFPQLLATFEKARVVHIVRNPLDSVASLVRRGFTPFFSAGLWVYNAGMGIRSRKSDRYTEVRYEELTSNPVCTLRELCDFLDIDYDPQLLEITRSTAEMRSLSTWTHSAEGEISTPAIGSFERTSSMIKDEIRTALSVIRISEKHMAANNLNYRSCAELCSVLGYDFDPRVNLKNRPKIYKDYISDAMHRSLKRYRTGFRNLPATLDWK